ncbi:MAG: hypothetical protein ACYC0J_10115, partial [Gammaproteobacteria bacterium]
LNTPMRIHRILHHLLQRFGKSDDRFSILQEAIAKAAKSLYIIVHELEEQGKEHLEEEDTFLPLEFRDLTPDQLTSLKQLAVTRIKAWADNGSLAEHPRLLPILFAWLNWDDAENCRHYVDEMTKTDKGLIAFLIATLDSAIDEAMTEYEKKAYWQDLVQDIEVFIPVSKLEHHAKAVFEDGYFEKLREREQLALMIFLDLVQSNAEKVIPKTSG